MRCLSLTVALLAAVLLASSCSKQSSGEAPDSFRARVLEYLPAPGQFVNDGWSAQTAQEAAAYAQARLDAGNYVTLGSFGGRITVVFERNGIPGLANGPGADFGIKGNASESSSEPGIVWVSIDSNGNGLADDSWFELAGSSSLDSAVVRNYSVTYLKAADGEDVPWTDNLGGSGSVPYINYHKQNYFPAWISGGSMTLSGTLLPARNYDSSGSGTMWINPSYGSGYADNWDPDNTRDGYICFDISNAILPDGTPAELERIDFVRVQNCVMASSGWLGEASTEVCGFAVFD